MLTNLSRGAWSFAKWRLCVVRRLPVERRPNLWLIKGAVLLGDPVAKKTPILPGQLVILPPKMGGLLVYVRR